jgi:2-polyprenyl-6-methoxyphenol hydroxylase-like FAD-dependent oxidoreductase
LSDADHAGREWAMFVSNYPVVGKMLGGRNFPKDLAHFHTAYGNSPRYGAEGVFLMGDAAHPVTPAGGQGANLSVADAAALAEIIPATLAQVLPASDENPLTGYERVRRPAAERSLRMSRGVARLFSLPDAIISRLVPTMIRIVGLRPQIFSPVLKTTATAFASDPSAGKGK